VGYGRFFQIKKPTNERGTFLAHEDLDFFVHSDNLSWFMWDEKSKSQRRGELSQSRCCVSVARCQVQGKTYLRSNIHVNYDRDSALIFWAARYIIVFFNIYFKQTCMPRNYSTTHNLDPVTTRSGPISRQPAALKPKRRKKIHMSTCVKDE